VHYRNLDPSVASDVLGKADSVHFLMLPAVDAARVNPVAESRFQTLQLAVSLTRLGRERRKIRNNLPLRRVIVVAAKAEDVDALSYLSSYFQEEINAWKVTLSTDTSLCTLKTFPEFKVLGARCGGRMKEVQRAISALSLSGATPLFLTRPSHHALWIRVHDDGHCAQETVQRRRQQGVRGHSLSLRTAR
jgi:hypothetical protein